MVTVTDSSSKMATKGFFYLKSILLLFLFSENWIVGNLGAVIKPGIILPSDRTTAICLEANDGGPGWKVCYTIM